MDNTGFILAFLRDLEKEMKKIGLKSVIDLKILKRDMFLEDPNTLGVMFVKGMSTYILTSQGRIKILGEAFRGKNLELDKKNNYVNLFFQKYECKLSNNLKGSAVYSIKKVPMSKNELDDIKLVRNFDKKDESRRQVSLVEHVNFNEHQRLKMGLEVKRFVMYELGYLSGRYNPKDGFMGIDWYVKTGKLDGNMDANKIYLCEDDIINIGNLVEMAIVNVGMPSESFSGNIRDFCYTLLLGLQLYIDDIEMVATKRDKYKKQLSKYLAYFTLEPKEDRGLDFIYDYNKTFLNGIGVLEIVKDSQVLYGFSDDGNIRIDKYNGLSLERKYGKKCN